MSPTPSTPASLSALRVLMQPGWHNSGPQHWQSIWEQRLHSQAQRVQQADWEYPDRDHWVRTLRAAILAAPEPVLLITHSIGCIAAAHLLSHPDTAELRARTAAAILVAPADVDREGAAPELDSFRPVPMQPLGVPALVVASTNDPYCTLVRARSMAEAWHADLDQVSDAGHINAASGYGPWPEGWLLVENWFATRGLEWVGPEGNYA